MSLTLIIGTKKWSSWSLRPWVALKEAGIPFKEMPIHLRQSDTKARILEYSPAGKVPILIDGRELVWDSLAILDYLAVRFPEAKLWPQDLSALAVARSVSAEMHSGFPDLRKELPMDIGVELPMPDLSAGPFLFGRFTTADAMYAPVVTRFRTYSVPVDPGRARICRRSLACPRSGHGTGRLTKKRSHDGNLLHVLCFD